MSEDDLLTEAMRIDSQRQRAAKRKRRTSGALHPPHQEPERRFQVFVSSTFKDLRSERQEVIQALLELECIPAGMEMFLAADEDQWTLIESVIDDCDYYVLIVGGRYGSLTEAGLSYTEREYDYAVRKGLPILAFLHDDPASLAARDVDADPEAIAKLEAFRKKARERPVRTFASPAELGSVVSRSLVRQMKRNPGEGWVRGRFATDPKTATEMAQLRTEVAVLRLELERTHERRVRQVDMAELESRPDLAEIRYVYGGRPRARSETWKGTWAYGWAHLFQLLGSTLLDEANDADLAERLAADIHAELQGRGFVKPVFAGHVSVDAGSLAEVKVQLRSMGLIEPGKRRRAVTETSAFWALTQHGEAVLMDMTKVSYAKRPPDELPQNEAPRQA